jgi:hypothetical protein
LDAAKRTGVPFARVDVAALCPFEVGVLRWSAPGPALTLVVKATWALAPGVASSPMKLAARQEPVSADRIAGDEVLYASDFVPFKPKADVVVTGHARAAVAARSIAVRLAVGEIDRVVYALAAEPQVELPLSASYLRVAARPDARATGVGPSPTWRARPLLGAKGAADLIGPSGAPRAALDPEFDFGLFNVAPAEQQLASLREDARVTLEGVAPGGARVEARLPGVRPRVFLADGGGAPTQELAVACDTLAVDVDRMTCVTVWRGAVVLEPGRREPALVVVAAQSPGDVLDWPMVLGNLFAARCVRAAEPPATGALPKLFDDDDSASTVGRWRDETTTRAREVFTSAPPPPLAPSAPPDDATHFEGRPRALPDDEDDPNNSGPTRKIRRPPR